MPMRRTSAVLLLVALLVAAAARLGAQAQVPHQLSLQQALQLAKANNPTYRQAVDAADPAAEAVKEAKWAILPRLSLNGGMGYTGSGSQTFGGTVFTSSSLLSSNYGFNASMQLSPQTWMTPSLNRAQERVADENINVSGVTLTSNVSTQYFTVLRALATVNVAIQQITADSGQLRLAQAKQAVGQASLLDVLSAQTAMANHQVQLLQARQAATQAKITLVQMIGMPGDANVDSLALTEPYPLTEPHFDLAQLEASAHTANPSIRSLLAQDHANSVNVHIQKLARLPTVSLSAGLSGYTQESTDENSLIVNRLQSAQGQEANCAFQNQILLGLNPPLQGSIIPDCKAFSGLDATGTALQPSIVNEIHAENSVFPFAFTRNPLSVNLQFSLPLWDGYSRSLAISQAEAARDEGRESLRAQQLATDAQIQSQLLAVTTAWQRIGIQDSNRVTARQQLQLAQDKYRIGNGSVLDVSAAQTAMTQAEADYVNAIYDYHLAVVALEAAVGRPLR
ncbi:MAG TPA: TolC family protein [Gemmatimonadales bacterium]|jgi:outer membrane protein